MKKTSEKVVEWIDSTSSFLTKGKKYIEIPTISSNTICVRDDNGRETEWSKERFKVVSEREVLEFEGLFADNGYLEKAYNVTIKSEIDLTNYDIKVTATPKDISFKTYEEMSKEELIELLKSKE